MPGLEDGPFCARDAGPQRDCPVHRSARAGFGETKHMPGAWGARDRSEPLASTQAMGEGRVFPFPDSLRV